MLQRDLIKILYLSLKGKDTNVKSSAEAADIETLAEGVRVHLKYGTTVKGTLVTGTDSVHSKTRKLMYKLAKDAAEEAMVSSFYRIFGQASMTDLPIASEEGLQFVALKPLPKPSAERSRYTKEDADDFSTSIADIAIYLGITFEDAWARANKNISW
ncbi:hypothetical protein F5X99DRAFT_409548 [Biscogniauxia marginata]|nr:hypothetical protein F5X99DRAFT_409548 [Biscogniauxia marginata]